MQAVIRAYSAFIETGMIALCNLMNPEYGGEWIEYTRFRKKDLFKWKSQLRCWKNTHTSRCHIHSFTPPILIAFININLVSKIQCDFIIKVFGVRSCNSFNDFKWNMFLLLDCVVGFTWGHTCCREKTSLLSDCILSGGISIRKYVFDTKW